MKVTTSLYVAALAAAATASVQAQTVIDITGSSAGRSAVHNGITSLLTGTTTAWNGGSSVSGATRAVYKGNFQGTDVIIRTYYSGSAAGIRDVANAPQLNNQYLKTDVATSGGTGTVIDANALPGALAPASSETVSEIGFSDVFQSSTEFTANPLDDESQVGIIPFKFFKNDGANAALTNITPGQFRALYRFEGELPLSVFTGNAAHASTTVFAMGRNDESGTRITALAETGAGIFNGVQQYQANVANGVISSLTFVGNGGYNSGSLVATALGGTYTGGTIVSYLGSSDWTNAVDGGAVELTFNGVAYSPEAVRNGSYSFWGYLHQSRRPMSDPTTLNFYNSLKAAIQSNPGSTLIQINSDLKVERAADGAPITPR